MSKTKRVLLLDGRHPLEVMKDAHGVGIMAKALGHANHTSVSEYCARAKRKRAATAIPAEWVLPLYRLSGIIPHVQRPDLYLPHWIEEKVDATV